nr:hypothetical protein [Gemmobacter aquatilis]
MAVKLGHENNDLVVVNLTQEAQQPVILPWPAPPEAEEVIHPAPIHVTEDGPVALPSYTPEVVA